MLKKHYLQCEHVCMLMLTLSSEKKVKRAQKLKKTGKVFRMR